MVLRMNATIRKVLREVLMGLLITEPTWKGGKLVEEDDDLEQKRFRVGVDLCLGAMRSLSERERERERAHNYNPKQIDRKKKGYVCMNMWRAKNNCIMGSTNPNLAAHNFQQRNIYLNAWNIVKILMECNAWSYSIK